MTALSGPAVATAVLLVIGGASKARRPGDTTRALRALRLPGGPAAVRCLAMAELAIGGAALVDGGRLAWGLIALSYFAFAGFVVFAIVRGGALSSCGCFGRRDTPPTVTHVLVALCASAVAFAAAVVHTTGPLFAGWSRQPLLGVPFVVLTACCVWFAYAAIAILPTAIPPSTTVRRS